MSTKLCRFLWRSKSTSPWFKRCPGLKKRLVSDPQRTACFFVLLLKKTGSVKSVLLKMHFCGASLKARCATEGAEDSGSSSNRIHRNLSAWKSNMFLGRPTLPHLSKVVCRRTTTSTFLCKSIVTSLWPSLWRSLWRSRLDNCL